MKREQRDVLLPETFAVLACAQAVVHPRLRERARGAVAACASAERLCETAVRHGMLGHLHKLLSGGQGGEGAAAASQGGDGAAAASQGGDGASVASQGGEGDALAAAREALAALSRVSAERALRQTAQLLRLLEALEARGVEALPIKGPAWAERLYGDVTLRNWVDLDLVVRYEDAAAARQALLEDGFLDSSPYAERLLRRRTRTEGELALHSSDHDVLVDVHWQMGVGYGAEALSGDALLARAEPATLLGRPVRGPNAVDMLLLTCLHGTRHRWDSVGHLLELGVQVRGLAPRAWPAAITAARAAGCERRVTVAVAHACRVFALPVPPSVAAEVSRSARVRSLLASLTPASVERGGERSAADSLLTLGWNWATEDSLSGALEHAALRALRPGPEDWAALPLPAALAPLYWPLRPLRLGLKYARAAGSRGRRYDAAG